MTNSTQISQGWIRSLSEDQIPQTQYQKISIYWIVAYSLPRSTSSLDAETEKKIQDALNVLTTNKTSIVIAHRLSTILNSDNIYVIQSGNVMGSGKHEELLKKSEIYKNFYEKQIQK